MHPMQCQFGCVHVAAYRGSVYVVLAFPYWALLASAFTSGREQLCRAISQVGCVRVVQLSLFLSPIKTAV